MLRYPENEQNIMVNHFPFITLQRSIKMKGALPQGYEENEIKSIVVLYRNNSFMAF